MKTLFFLLAFASVTASFANNTQPLNTEPGNPEVLSITLPLYGKGGFDMNSGEACPDWCWLCSCGSVTFDFLVAPDPNGFELIGKKGVYNYEGRNYNIEVLSNTNGKQVTVNGYQFVESTLPLRVKVLR